MTRSSRRVALACAALAVLAFAAPGATARRPVARASAGPVFANHHEPGETQGSGEPSIGVNWKTGTVMYQSRLRTLAVTWDAKDRATWTNRGFILKDSATLDPILYTDGPSGRTWVSQLAANCSLLSYTDDDGKTWQPSTGCGPGAYLDHQTVGAAPFAKALLPSPGLAPVAVYYCAQAVVDASCARSDDGGRSFGPAVPIYTIAECGGLHGHLRGGPDGTVYVPHMGCGGDQAVVVSEDNGLTWDVRKIPDTEVSGESDPSVAIGADNTVYVGYQDGGRVENTRAMVAVSRDHGRSWANPVDVGRKFGLKNVQFPQMIAGDGDRAAMAFLGTTKSGNDQVDSFDGEWRLYIAMTYDRGRTWTTVNATPHELVQRGCIKLTGCSHRNLLDFNDVTVDKQGRVYAAWADGCPVECERGAKWKSSWSGSVITRQSAGKGLFRAYDGKL